MIIRSIKKRCSLLLTGCLVSGSLVATSQEDGPEVVEEAAQEVPAATEEAATGEVPAAETPVEPAQEPAPNEDEETSDASTIASEEAPVQEEPAPDSVTEEPAQVIEPTPASAATTGDLVIADFEGGDFANWTVEGDAFGAGPANGSIEGQMEVSGFQGQGLANSFHGSDSSVGTLTSPEFTIERSAINLLVGGGRHPDTVHADLVVGGQTVRSASGPESETLQAVTWDVAEFAGQSAMIVLADQRTGGWGHLLVDQIVQSNERLAPVQVARQRELPVIGPKDRYLNLPVKNGAPKVRMSFVVGGQVAREFDIELSDEPDFWVFAELTAFAGKSVNVMVDALAEDSKALDLLEVGETIKNADQLYKEANRPQVHFSTKRGWINDPNGLVYYKGEYHLFYQHNPYGHKWGNMHWGHAVSVDLVHWEQLPIALYPKAYGDWAFSGGALIDSNNTSGFKSGSEDPMVAFYTSTGRGECVVYSNDRGRTWTEYEGNPVVKHQGRDPKVIWHDKSQQWVMAVYNEHEDGRYIAFHTSKDLKDWTFQSRIEGFYECPELFEARVNLNPSDTRWVLYGADSDYLLGQFDGKTFTPDGEKIKSNYGNCFYASQMFSNVPSYDGRQIQVGWGKVDTPGMPFNQLMLFPTALRLKNTAEGPRLHTLPVKELGKLHGKTVQLAGESISSTLPIDVKGGLYDLNAVFELGGATSVGFNVRGVPVVYDVAKAELSCIGQTAPLAAKDGKISLRVLVDRTTIEIYANGGVVYMPIGTVLDVANESISVTTTGSGARVTMTASELNSIWSSTFQSRGQRGSSGRPPAERQ